MYANINFSRVVHLLNEFIEKADTGYQEAQLKRVRKLSRSEKLSLYGVVLKAQNVTCGCV